MSNEPHTGTNPRESGQASSRRRFLSALGLGVLAGTARFASGHILAGPRDETTRSTDHKVRIDGRVSRFEITVPDAHYQRVTGAEHSFSATFAAAQHQSYLATATADLAKQTSDRASAIRAAQSLAAGITYATDEASTGKFEFIRYPAETLVDGCGDCEDKAILLAGLLSRPPLDCRTALLIVPYHCATLVARADLPRSMVAAEPLSVTVGGTEYVYVEGVETVQPGRTARDYGDRPQMAAYDGHWTVLNTVALLDWGREAADRHGPDLVDAAIR